MVLWVAAALAGEPAPEWCVAEDGLLAPLRAALALAWPEVATTVRTDDSACSAHRGLSWDGQRLVWADDRRRLEAEAPAALDAVLLARTWSLTVPPPPTSGRYLPAPPPEPPRVEPPPVELGARPLQLGVGARAWASQPRAMDGVRVVLARGPRRVHGLATEASIGWAPTGSAGAPADPAFAASLCEPCAVGGWDDRVTVGVTWVMRPVASRRYALRVGLGPEVSWSDRWLEDGGMTWTPSSAVRPGAMMSSGASVSLGSLELVAQGVARGSGLDGWAWDVGAELDVRYRLW